MSPADWAELLTGFLDRANLALQRGDRRAAADDTARGAELLFLQAQIAKTLDEKRRFVKRAGQLLETSLTLDGSVNFEKESTAENPAPACVQAACVKTSGGKTLTFENIAGLGIVKETLLQRLIYPLKYPEKLQRYGISSGGGMLLYGPPGTGKTLLARAVAGELGLPFYVIKSSEVLSQYYGQSEKQLADLFQEARKSPDGAVIFLDEIDALGAKRTEQMNEASRRVINQLLQELDGVGGKSEKLVFLAATNEPWLLDSALLRPPRFCEKCYIPLPDATARRTLFDMSLQDCPVDHTVSMESLVRRSNGLSGADIVNVCEHAKLIPFCEAVNTGIDRPVAQDDFDTAMQNAQPSVTPELLARFERWKR
ncbi:MAG: ATP-binding protein [Planctomycetaceae bacterium]|jgi:SpoVK/Ycf46/Vps4 family AAA+-type ATPase|nr:ATP-binding protein [Planctomycetaceae bacterium]